MIRRIMTEALVGAANAVLLFVAMAAGFRVVYPIVFSVLKIGRVEPGFHAGLTEYQAIVFSVSLAFAVAALLSRLWTPRVLNVAIVSGLVFLTGIVLLGRAIYLTDGGDPNLIWSYVGPRSPEFLGALWCGAASALGWHSGGRLWRSRPSGLVAGPPV